MATRINGVFWDYSDIELSFVAGDRAREIVAEIPEINYAHAITRNHVYGTGKYPLDTTSGRYEPSDGSIVFYAQRYRELLSGLGDAYAHVKFKVQVKMRNGDGPLFVDELEGYIAGDDNAHAQGGDALVTTVPIMWTLIKINGKRLV